jgi:hypothetical protein
MTYYFFDGLVTIMKCSEVATPPSMRTTSSFATLSVLGVTGADGGVSTSGKTETGLDIHIPMPRITTRTNAVPAKITGFFIRITYNKIRAF